jgi:DHA2 family multidrug resistance protein
MRNLGSSIGVSMVITFLTKDTQTNHAYLSENITIYNSGLAERLLPHGINNAEAGLSLLNGEITRQAATIGYINDFAMMMWIVICAIPLVFFLRNPNGKKENAEPAEAVME